MICFHYNHHNIISLQNLLISQFQSISSIVAVTVRQGTLGYTHVTLKGDQQDTLEDNNNHDRLNKSVINIEGFQCHDIEKINPNVDLDKLFNKVNKT